MKFVFAFFLMFVGKFDSDLFQEEWTNDKERTVIETRLFDHASINQTIGKVVLELPLYQ